MSGIAGIYFLDGRPVAHADLQQLVDLLAHRGPDGADVWCGGSVGLGHRMLWTTPESLQEKLPLVSRSGDLVITADARLDNREELISRLGLAGRSPIEISDSQLILAAYERWGERCPERLVGDFAFAIWDATRGNLFCARDPIGINPFYYYQNDRVFVFASEIKAILCLPEVPRQLNPPKIAEHLLNTIEDTSSTFYRDISRLPAAHTMTICPDRGQVNCYWSLDPSFEVHLPSDEAYAEAFRERFDEAVRCRLRSAYPIGTALSGGLDSSSITCTARKLRASAPGRPLHTYSAIFPGVPEADLPEIDERQYVKAVVDEGGLQAHYIRADRLSPLADLNSLLWHQDEAILAPNLFIHMAMYAAARDNGVRVFLDGTDGDTTVSYGLDYFTELARTGRWRTLVREATLCSRNAKATASHIIWRFGVRPLAPEVAVRAWRIVRRSPDPDGGGIGIINPQFARQLGLADRLRDRPKNGTGSGAAARGRAQHWQGLNAALIPYLQEVINKAAAPFAVEARYPYFDRRLIEFCLALPPNQKLAQGWPRLIQRRAMAGVLPDAIRWRFSKAKLGSNFRRRLLVCEKKRLDKVILDEPDIIAAYVDTPALQAIYRRYEARLQLSNWELMAMYSAVMLALWLRQSVFFSR